MNYQKSLSNKISPLVPGKVLLRDRLFSLFDRPPPNSCFWISGPGGSGKSTLIASYLNHQDLPCLWYQVDVLDGDPSNFFYYLGQAAIALTEQEKPPLPLLTPEYLLDVDSFIVRYFEALYQHLNSPCWIIFDNFQDAPADSLVQHILTKAIEMLPHHVTMAIISRSDPPPEMARFRANRSMSLIDWKQIAFTRDEFYDFVQFSGYRLDEKEIEKIFKLTDGWVSGAILWLSHSGKENVSQCFPIETTPESIFDYFGSEILAKTEFQIKEFLLKTALFPHMSADMASQLTDLDAEVILEDLDRRNFFLEKRNLPTISYQYHPLFREFLLNRASRFFNSASLGDLRCLGAQILIDNGLIEQGVDLYILAQEYEPLISLILSHASVLTSQGRHQIIISWIAGLPPKYCETNPWLLFWKGIGLVTTRPFESQALYMQSYELFKQKDDLAGQALSWSMTIDTYPLLRSTFFQLDYWIPEGIQLAESLFDKMDTNSQGRFANSMLTALITRSPGHPDIYRWQSRCEELFEQCFDEQVIVSLGSVLCLSYNQLGQIHKAHIMLTALQPLVDKIDVPPLSRLFCNIWVCTLLLSTGRWTECHKMIDETLALAKETGIYVANFLLLSSIVCLLLLFASELW